jgi:hypothetical protein
MYIFCVVLCDVCFVPFPVLFVCICVLNNCHRVATQLQLNISYFYLTKKSNQPEEEMKHVVERNDVRNTP